MQKIIVYTAIMGAKDAHRDDIKVFSDADYAKFVSPVMNAKIFKILPHKFLEYDISVWLDGNIYLKIPVEQLITEFLGKADMAVFEHYHKKDIYWEAKMLNSTFKNRTPWVRNEVNEQVKHYERTKIIPARSEMAMGGLIIRRNNLTVNRFNEAWWAEICRWSQRDQLSLPVIIKQFPNLKVNLVPGSIKTHPYLRYENHSHYYT